MTEVMEDNCSLIFNGVPLNNDSLRLRELGLLPDSCFEITKDKPARRYSRVGSAHETGYFAFLRKYAFPIFFAGVFFGIGHFLSSKLLTYFECLRNALLESGITKQI